MKPQRCEHLAGTSRCNAIAAYEFIRSGIRDQRWRSACAECMEVIRKHSSPLDGLKIRLIEIDAEDEAVRRRKIKQL